MRSRSPAIASTRDSNAGVMVKVGAKVMTEPTRQSSVGQATHDRLVKRRSSYWSSDRGIVSPLSPERSDPSVVALSEAKGEGSAPEKPTRSGRLQVSARPRPAYLRQPSHPEAKTR